MRTAFISSLAVASCVVSIGTAVPQISLADSGSPGEQRPQVCMTDSGNPMEMGPQLRVAGSVRQS